MQTPRVFACVVFILIVVGACGVEGRAVQMQGGSAWVSLFNKSMDYINATMNYTLHALDMHLPSALLNGSADAVIADLFIDSETSRQNGFIQLPMFATSMVVPFNVPANELPAGVTIRTGARIERNAIIKIALGLIQYWDDPELRTIFNFATPEIEKTAVIPKKRIWYITRGTLTGTHKWWLSVLGKFNSTLFPWEANDFVIQQIWPIVGPRLQYKQTANSEEAVAKAVKNTPWSVAYCLLSAVLEQQVNIFGLVNMNGEVTVPTSPVISDTMEATIMDDQLVSDNIDMPGHNVYPSFVTPALVVRNASMTCDVARQVMRLWRWLAFNTSSRNDLHALSLAALSTRYWQAQMYRVHTDWKCIEDDGSVAPVIPNMQFVALKSTPLARHAFMATASSFSTSDLTPDVALVDTTKVSRSSITMLTSPDPQCAVLPMAATGVTFLYNLPVSTSSGELVLSMEAIVGIFNGSIATWNHPLISVNNRFLPLPDESIQIVIRGDAGGRALTDGIYATLSAVNPAWKAMYGTMIASDRVGSPTSWFPGVAANRITVCETGKGSKCTVTGEMKGNPYTLTYTTADVTVSVGGLFVASLLNSKGEMTLPDEVGVLGALNGVDLGDRTLVIDAPDRSAYPVVAIAGFQVPLVFMAEANERPLVEEAIAVAQEGAGFVNLQYTQAALATCPSVVAEMQFVLWTLYSPTAVTTLSGWEFVSVGNIDDDRQRDLLTLKCVPADAKGSEYFARAVNVFERIPTAPVVVHNTLSTAGVLGLVFAFVCVLMGGVVGFALWSRRQLKMVQKLSIAVATFDLDSMAWLESKPAKGLTACYKQILVNMKIYKQYLPASLTERHADDDSAGETPTAAENLKTARKTSLPNVDTDNSNHKASSQAAKKRHGEDSASRSQTKQSYGTVGAQVRRGTFMVVHLAGLNSPSTSSSGDGSSRASTDLSSRQSVFNACFAVINKAVRDKRGLVEDFGFDRVVCHWNLSRNVGDYRLLACECALTLQRDLMAHIRSNNLEVSFDIAVTSGDIALSSIGNDTKQRISWISKAWLRNDTLHAVNLGFGTSVTIDETTKSAVEYSVECLLLDVAGSGQVAGESVFVYEVGGNATQEDGEWMYHNNLKRLNSPDEATNTTTSVGGDDSEATQGGVGRAYGNRSQISLAWSGIVTALAVRRNRQQALSQLETFLKNYEANTRLRAQALELRAFLVQQIADMTSGNITSPTAGSGIGRFASGGISFPAATSKVSQSALVPNAGSSLSLGSSAARESFVHLHAPITFQWLSR